MRVGLTVPTEGRKENQVMFTVSCAIFSTVYLVFGRNCSYKISRMTSSSDSEFEWERNRYLWADTDSSSSDFSDNSVHERQRAPRNFRRRMDHMNEWNNEEFQMRFRLSKDTVLGLEDRIGHIIAPLTARNHAVTAIQQILLFLRFCATGCMLQTIADFVGIHKSTASQIVKKVVVAVNSLAPEYICMPSVQEVELVKRKFHEIARFPRVIGAIDCTHVRILSPGGNDAENFRNRKGYFSLNIQVIGDQELRIRDIVARWPGSSHDQTIFNHSRVHARFEAGEFNDSILLGDSGYAIKKYLITPLLNPTTQAEQLFNESQIRSRNPIERLFGVIKRRFPILSLGVRLSIGTTQAIIIACAILHNMALNMKDPEPMRDPNVIVLDEEDDEENNVPNIDLQNYRQEFVLYFMNLLEDAQ